MQEAWINVRCPDCEESWEATPTELPAPASAFTCPHCDVDHSMSEFMQTKRDLEILSEFHD